MSMNLEFKRNPLLFFRTYPVAPPGVTPQGLGGGLEQGKKLSTASIKTGKTHDTEDILEYSVKAGMAVRRVDFNRATTVDTPNAVTFNLAEDDVFRLDSAHESDSVAIHFLPWKTAGLTQMRIPELSSKAVESSRNPSVFFTASISGCSVFVRGDPAYPEVYHGGIDNTLNESGAALWRRCLGVLTKRVLPSGKYEVNKADYTKNEKFMRTMGALSRTALGNDLFKWLSKQHGTGQTGSEFIIKEVNPWGCVFGLRYGRLWSFYLQENATVIYTKFVYGHDVYSKPTGAVYGAPLPQTDPMYGKPKMISIDKKTGKEVTSVLGNDVYVETRTECQTMAVRDFFPGGPHTYKSFAKFSRLSDG